MSVALRTLILILILGGCYFGFTWWKDKSQDLSGVVPAHTAGWLAAVQFQDQGQQAVAFSADGKMTPSSGWKPGNTDRDITWNPSGNRVFFVSDREENNFHVFRWNPTDGSDPVRRTIGSRSRSLPMFPRQASEDADGSALITSGGLILEYRPKDLSMVQVLPPIGREIVESNDESGGGAEDQFSGAYEKFGNAFKVARWCKGKNWIAAIMVRDEGEVLIVQNMQPTADGKQSRPEPVAAGDHVSFDVNPQDGSIVFSVQNFQWPNEDAIPPQFHKGNVITRPFANFVGRIDPDDKSAMTPIAASADDKICFGPPSISPDGASIVLVQGKYENAALTPLALVSMPITQGGERSEAVLAKGQIFEPNWSADGQLIAFAQRQPSGKRAICTIHNDGTGQLNLTGESGNFGTPVFSPQAKS
jgi:hypothetical protein